MKLTKLAQCIALIGIAGPVLAQEATEPAMQKVEVTGSSIKRIAKEGALPIQVITASDLTRSGVTSAEGLMRMLTVNGNGADNMTSGNNVFGADSDRVSGGASFASLRGLGPSSTLVLLNGRRLSTHGASGKAVDLNSIPMAAIARIEILKDGASAIYGTDAIGGVINFILKTDYQGAESTVSSTAAQDGGGLFKNISVTAGKGSLDTDGYNVMATLTADKTNILRSNQRSFSNGYQPSRGLSPDTTGTPVANQLTGAGTALGTGFKMPGDSNTYLQAGLLSLQGKCDSVPGMMQYATSLWKDVTSPLRTTYSCAYDYGADYVMIQPVEHQNLLSHGTFKINADTRAIFEVTASRTDAIAILTPAQISTSIANKNVYPVGGPYYQDLSAYISTFDKTKPIAYKWRASDFGNRTQENLTTNARLLLGLEGTWRDWDYKTGVSRGVSRTDTSLLDGYVYTDKIYSIMGSGIINPFIAPGNQTAAAMQAIEGAKFRGGLQSGETTLNQFDGSVSGKVWELPAGPLLIALGFDYRQESYYFTQFTDATKILLAPGNANLPEANRTIKALYAEAIIPATKNLEFQLAVRRDDYSAFGSTTNPKLAFRYQPVKALVFRGSANTGFLAPSFTQLYSGSLSQELPNGTPDPLLCPQHPGDATYCSIARLPYTSGGNKDLKPQTSKQASLGFVAEVTKGFTGSIDIWRIETKNTILNRTPQQVLANYQSLSEDIIRDPATNQIVMVKAGWINAAGAVLSGADVSLNLDGKAKGFDWSVVMNGTYLNSYKYHDFENQPYTEYVGKFYTRDLYLRWKHNLSLIASRNDWSAMLTQNYASGYKDDVPNGGIGVPPAGFNPDVHSYTTYNASLSYKGIKNLTLTVGVQNLLNTNPPFTAHNVDNVVGAGWDPRVANPLGRALSVNATYKFL